MLIDFTISNFRSIKEAQTLSFHAAHSPENLTDNIHYPAEQKIGVLACAGIYGANASGKSNFLLALDALQGIIIDVNNLKDGEAIKAYQPYRLSSECKQKPTIFELEFALLGARYIYRVEFNAASILYESLDFFPKNRAKAQKANLFKRAVGQGWKDISFGNLFKGGTKRFPFFNNVSYLSKAGNSADAPEEIRQVYNYFRNNLIYEGIPKSLQYFAWKNDVHLVKKVGLLLSAIDTGVAGLVIQKEEKLDKFLQEFPSFANMVDLPEPVMAKLAEQVDYTPYFQHQSEDGNIELFLEESESTGTTMLLDVLPRLMQVIESGSILIWDEIESSLHPHVAELIVRLFHDPHVNRKHAQLLFTTHNLNLMTPQSFRKDQLWLTEKTSGATTISSLDDFDASLKSSSPFSKWYDEGRLGGIPNINYRVVSELITSQVMDNAQT